MVNAISRFEHVKLSDFPKDLRDRVSEIADKTGFVPNVFLVLAQRPDELRAFCDYHDAVMERTGALSKVERELIVVATSGANGCTYCVVAHGAILRVRSKDPRLSDEVATNPWGADVGPRQRAILDFALALAIHPERFTEADCNRARSAGLQDSELWEIGAVTALFALSNRMAHLTALAPNDEFFAMGRS